ncbi:unnamed protein product [Malus baccata var. baccata]|uniref:universal stress protein A-like protein n=1 Tax=Malus sylvestris TaxID=3752 RepID=UPI0021ABC293|nr:universal stress protein A-like protein [Malus sylvestris]
MEAEKMKSREHKIVVAVDESEESMHALSWCLGNLSSQNANNTLVLLYVKPQPVHSTFDAAAYMFSSDVVGSIEKYGTEMVNSVMQRAEAVYRNFQTNAHIVRVVGKGDPKNVICNTVEKLKADTLVMGSHGYGFFKRTILGSVSDYCAKHVECPVVIVKKS